MHGRSVIELVTGFVVDETGQDLIEYALLSGLLGVGGFLFFSQLVDGMGTAYKDWVTAVYNASGEPPPPGSSP